MSLTKATYSMIEGAPVSVLDFGAVGNGVTDDTAAIQAALDSGANAVFFPARKGAGTALTGSYRVTDTLTVSARTRLFGDAMQQSTNPTQVYLDVTSNIPLFNVTAVTVQFENLSLRGPGWDSGYGTAIRLNRGGVYNDARFENLWFTDFGDVCIYGLQGIQGAHFVNCTFDVNNIGIHVALVSNNSIFFNNVISSCRFYRCFNAIYMTNSFANRATSQVKNNVINGNIFDETGIGNPIGSNDAAIRFENGSYGNIITDNSFNNNSRGLYMSYGYGNIIENNVFELSNRNHITLIGDDDVTLCNNKFYDANKDNVATADEDCAVYINAVTSLFFNYNSFGVLSGTPTPQFAVYALNTPTMQSNVGNLFDFTPTNDPLNVLTEVTLPINTAVSNGWNVTGGSLKIKKIDNVVNIRGAVANGTTTTGTVIYTLDTLFRPVAPVVRIPTLSNGNLLELNIATNGQITFVGTASIFWIDLNISFYVG